MNSITVALAYLGRFARTEFQIKRYLQRKGFSASEVSDAIDYLREHQFLNDDAYAQSYIESRIRKLDGPLKIKQLLIQKGIEAPTAQKLLQDLYPVEVQIENAARLADKKRSRTRDQLKRFVASRGYSPYVIMRSFNAKAQRRNE